MHLQADMLLLKCRLTMAKMTALGWIKPGTAQFLAYSRAFGLVMVLAIIVATATALDLLLAGGPVLVMLLWSLLATVCVGLVLMQRISLRIHCTVRQVCSPRPPLSIVLPDPSGLYRPPRH